MKKAILSLFFLAFVVTGANIGGLGVSEQDAMVYYLIGNQTTFPNLKLSIWSEIEKFDKETYGEKFLHGELALRVDDWVDYDENAQPYDNKMVDMGFMFKNDTDVYYDGMRAQFLFNSTEFNDPRFKVGYNRNFLIQDVYSFKLREDLHETHQLTLDDQDRWYSNANPCSDCENWELIEEKSLKECLEPGVCAFIVGFKRRYETIDSTGRDIRISDDIAYQYNAWGFYAEYLDDNTQLKLNAILDDRYAISENQRIYLRNLGTIPDVEYPEFNPDDLDTIGLKESSAAEELLRSSYIGFVAAILLSTFLI